MCSCTVEIRHSNEVADYIKLGTIKQNKNTQCYTMELNTILYVRLKQC